MCRVGVVGAIGNGRGCDTFAVGGQLVALAAGETEGRTAETVVTIVGAGQGRTDQEQGD